MMFNSPRPLERTSRLWRFDDVPTEDINDGPNALLRSVIALALRHKIKLIVCIATGIALAAWYAHSLPRTYNATATLLLEPRQAAVSRQDLGGQQSLDLNRADSELQIIRSERLLSGVFESLDLQNSPELAPQPPGTIDLLMAGVRRLFASIQGSNPTELSKGSRSGPDALEISGFDSDTHRAAFLNFASRLNARRVGQSYVIEIEYSSSDPTLPARVANAAVSAYFLQTVAFKAQMARAGTEALQGRLDALAAQVDAASEAMTQGKLPSTPTPDADARIIGAALAPLGPSGPRTSLITALGGVLGLLGGFGVVAINRMFDRKVRNPKELVRDTGIACLGCIPDMGDGARIPLHLNTQQLRRYAAAIRDLRTSMEIACSALRKERSIIIAIVGWTEGAGVSTLCLNLAQFISRSGRHVTLFQAAPDSDHQGHNDASQSVSLADVALAGPLPEALTFSDIDGVVVFPIHSADANVNLFADFRHPSVLRILDSARFRGDVLLDLPALNNSTDALALAIHADAIVIAARAGHTTTDEVRDSLQQLRRAGANVIGTVINKARP